MKNEIREEIARIEKNIFYAQMADFMDWGLYYRLTAKKAELQKKLEALENAN